jgi:ketosteroid isomerase-like protein
LIKEYGAMTVTRNETVPAADLPASREDALVDIHRVVDALYRFAAGQDQRNRELFESAFGHDAVVDFTQPAARFGKTFPTFVGRKVIADIIMGTTASMITTHSVTNPRVSVSGDVAHMSALVEAQHVLRDDASRNLLLKNFCSVTLSRSGAEWLIEHMKIENAWFAGDPTVLFPGEGS